MCLYICNPIGELAQLARALAWHARGHRFDSGILHTKVVLTDSLFYLSKAQLAGASRLKRREGHPPRRGILHTKAVLMAAFFILSKAQLAGASRLKRREGHPPRRGILHTKAVLMAAFLFCAG